MLKWMLGGVRSLRFKWILSLVVTSLAGVLLVAVQANRVTGDEFDRLQIEEGRENFIAFATEYYQTEGGWRGFGRAYAETQGGTPGNNPNSPRGEGGGQNNQNNNNQGNPNTRNTQDNRRPVDFVLLDRGGSVVKPSPEDERNGRPYTAEEIAAGQPLEIDGTLVGYVLTVGEAPTLTPREQAFLDRLNETIMLAAGVSGVAALLMGLLLAGFFLRPLRQLQGALRAVQSGQLDQRLPVRTKDELGELAAAFNQMSAELERVQAQRRQMTADIAHDLRTPLSVISGYLEGLRDGTLKPTPRRLDAMHEEVNLLQHLIQDLRTLSLADSGELRLHRVPVAPRALLERSYMAFYPAAQAAGVTLDIDAPEDLPPIQVDTERMSQVLGNLVSNAIRHTEPGGTVRLSALPERNGVRLQVVDTGEGIAADKLPFIFERFYRADEARQQTDSQAAQTGLGLAIARSLVEAHGGKISAASVLGRGTTISIQLSAVS